MMMRCRFLNMTFGWKKFAVLLVATAFVILLLELNIIGLGKTCSTSDNTAQKKSLNDIPREELDALKASLISEYKQKMQQLGADEPPNEMAKQSVVPIECLINDNYTVQCLKSTTGQETLYMPFDFLEKYFEVYGKMKHYDGYDRFEFSQSSHKVIFKPSPKYLYHGPFMTFDTYNVETRERVKCVSGITGVPVCTQWDPEGYFYPIQIAQFGMSHYSKQLLQTSPPQQILYEDGNAKQMRWKTSNRYCQFESVFDKESKSQVIKFSTPDSIPLGSGVTFMLGNTVERELSFDIKFTSNGSVTVVFDSTNRGKQYTINYLTNNIMMDYDGKSSVIYGIGNNRSWRQLSRNILIDFKKGVGKSKTKKTKKTKFGVQKVTRLILRGNGFIDNITLSTSNHLIHFKDACDWMVDNQDQSTGGWKNDIPRELPGFPVLPPGWLSAMGQGQGMSMLSRAFYLYGDMKYIASMEKALRPFSIASADGGVRASFMGKYTWYEEYPTTPSSFVLNGFMFSLIGLYDFKSALEDNFELPGANTTSKRRAQPSMDIVTSHKQVCALFEDGLTSLKAMLPLYDGGSRTFYDLRHFMLNMQPNVARWDYHTTHLSQLALFASVSKDTVFQRFYDYWYGYMKGEVSKHN